MNFSSPNKESQQHTQSMKEYLLLSEIYIYITENFHIK